jgi:hypothetical protein
VFEYKEIVRIVEERCRTFREMIATFSRSMDEAVSG